MSSESENETRTDATASKETSRVQHDELDDAALEHVVGGLARVWFDQVPDLPAVRQQELVSGMGL